MAIMATALDYALNMEAQMNRNQGMALNNQLAPLQTAIAAENARARNAAIAQSQNRFNSMPYLLGKLPPAARAAATQNPAIAAKIASLMQYGGAPAVNSYISGTSKNGDSLARDIQTGAGNDYEKATHTGGDIDQVTSARNAETTLSQIRSILPSVSKYAGAGSLSKGLQHVEAFFGGKPDEDYNNYNIFNETLKPQLAMQLRQFYKSNPTYAEQIMKEFAPHTGETSQMYLNRIGALTNNLGQELKQRQQDFTQQINTSGAHIGVGSIPNSNQDSFSSQLQAFGKQKGWDQ